MSRTRPPRSSGEITAALIRLSREVVDGKPVDWHSEFHAIAEHLARVAGVPAKRPEPPK